VKEKQEKEKGKENEKNDLIIECTSWTTKQVFA
jgi:hypothetical protein